MKANELRIGNYHLNDYGIPVQWDKWMFDSVHEFEELEAVPLTEEWLLKLGFKIGQYENFIIKDKEGHYVSVKYRQNIHSEYGWAFSNDESDANCYILTTIQYVHQLQNLYFALTGDELSITNQKNV